jgi:hypothetical protein
MKRIKSLIIGLVVVITSPLYSQTQSPISGIWDTGDQNTLVEIFEEGDFLKGKIVSSDNEKVEIGFIMLKDLKETKGSWNGKVYSFKKKEWFDVKIKPDGNELDLQISSGFMKRSKVWKKSS